MDFSIFDLYEKKAVGPGFNKKKLRREALFALLQLLQWMVSGQSYSWQIPTSPTVPSSGANSRVPLGAIGVALNGIPIYNAYDSSGNNLSEW